MQKTLSCIALFGLMPFVAFGGKPVATVTSGEAFTLNGHAMNTPGVTSFPVVVGDTVSTANAPAELVFPEGSTVKLGANSSVKVTGEDTKLKVILLAGALDFKLVKGSAMSVTNVNDDTPSAVSGALASPNKSPGLLSPKFLVPAGAAAGVGTAAGLALTLPPVSRHL